MNCKNFFQPHKKAGLPSAQPRSAKQIMELPEKEMDEAVLECRDEMFYPDRELRDWASLSYHSMVVQRPSAFLGAGNGSFALVDIRKGTKITLYSGRIIHGPLVGPVPYVMEIGGRFVDAQPSDNWLGGLFNEYIWDPASNNCRVSPSGVIIAKRNIQEGEEITISYSDDYNWTALIIELTQCLLEILIRILSHPSYREGREAIRETLVLALGRLDDEGEPSIHTNRVVNWAYNWASGATHRPVALKLPLTSEKELGLDQIAEVIDLKHRTTFRLSGCPIRRLNFDIDWDQWTSVHLPDPPSGRRASLLRAASRSALVGGAQYLPYLVKPTSCREEVQTGDITLPTIPAELAFTPSPPTSPARIGDTFRWEWEARQVEEGWTPTVRGVVRPPTPRPLPPSPSPPPSPAMPSVHTAPPKGSVQPRYFPIFDKGFIPPPKPQLGTPRVLAGSKGGDNSLVVASVNINGFNDHKQEWVALYTLENKIDIMVVVDTRLTDSQTGWAKRRISQILGKGISFVSTARGRNLPQDVPGGIIIISMPRIGNVVDKKDDPLRVGSRLLASFKFGPLPITVLGVYFPFNNRKAGIRAPEAVSKSLEHRMARALLSRGGDSALSRPVDYLWRYIGILSARSRADPLSSLVIAGDFNGTFGKSNSSYQDLRERASSAGLTWIMGTPPPTLMVNTIPRSSIDHILLSEGSPFSLRGVEADYDSAVVTDHAVLSGWFELRDQTLAHLPRRPPKAPKQPSYKELSGEDILPKFQEKVLSWQVEPVGSSREAGDSLLRLALRVTGLAHRLTRRSPQRRQGWSPTFVSLQSYELFLQ